MKGGKKKINERIGERLNAQGRNFTNFLTCPNKRK